MIGAIEGELVEVRVQDLMQPTSSLPGIEADLATYLTSCELCGDGSLSIYESCDDSNSSGNCVQCESSLTGWDCYTECHPICGDGLIVGDEVCDNGDPNGDC